VLRRQIECRFMRLRYNFVIFHSFQSFKDYTHMHSFEIKPTLKVGSDCV